MGESSRGTQLSLSGVTRSFNGRTALLPISFSIASGEFVSLLGPSGSGKSTLLRMIAGLETWDSGSVSVSLKPTAGSRSFVFQDPALLPWRTVAQNVALPLELAHKTLDARARRTLVEEAIERVGLSGASALYPNQLSGGMKMRASVARAIVSKPSLLLLDEPFAALDERSRFRLQEDLRGLWTSLGMTVVFVTHSASEAVFVSDRALVLSHGPGRILTDRRIDLGERRMGVLRNDPRYHSEVARLNEAFEQ
jgi:NitT/TauT family transport system ATP-binding protein